MSAVLAASIVALICLNLLPVFALFFSVPFFVLFFSAKKRLCAISVIVAFVIESAISFAILLQQPGLHHASELLSSCIGPATIMFPLLVMLLPWKLKLLYRIGIVGVVSGICCALFFLVSGETSAVIIMLRDVSEKISAFLVQNVPAGYEGAVLKSKFSSGSVYTIMVNAILYSILPFPVVTYTICAGLGYKIASWAGKSNRQLKGLSSFYNSSFLFVPLVAGMCGIMAGYILKISQVSVVSWNISLLAGFYFVLQGMGILLFFLGLLRRKTGRRPVLPFLLLVLLLITGGLPYFIGILLIAGVVELFVPVRSRFDNKDTVDPTPGRDSDQI